MTRQRPIVFLAENSKSEIEKNNSDYFNVCDELCTNTLQQTQQKQNFLPFSQILYTQFMHAPIKVRNVIATTRNQRISVSLAAAAAAVTRLN